MAESPRFAGLGTMFGLFVIAASTLCAVSTERVEAMQNPFLNDLKSISVACEGEQARSWCEIVSGLISEDMNVPVTVVDMSVLPLNASGLPSANHGWVTLSVHPSGDELAVTLRWGSAMQMAGVGNGRAAHTIGSIPELQNKDVWRQVLAPTPFIMRNK